MDDIVFKAMLASDTEDSREALRHLLSACIHREISTVQVINNDLIPTHLDAKASRLDVHVTFNDGEAADLEMQMDKSADDLKTRAVYYAAMLMSGQSRKGRVYGEIKRVYQIFFLNCVLFPNSNKLPRRYFYMEEKEHDRLTDVTEVIFYEMPKLESKVQDILTGKVKINNLPDDEKWCIYFKYRHQKQTAELIEKLYSKEEGIMLAERAVTGVSRDYKRFARWMAITKNRMEHAQMRYALKQEIRAEIYEEVRAEAYQEFQTNKKLQAKIYKEARKESTLEIARKMKDAGQPLKEIAKFTGLPARTIKQI